MLVKKAILLPTFLYGIHSVDALYGLKSSIAIVHGNFTPAASYLAPFATEDAVDQPFELIDDHQDLVLNHKGQIVSLRKRGDDCQKYHKIVGNENCYTLSLQYNVAESSIHEWNPQVNSHCTNLYNGKQYCVQKANETLFQESVCTKTFVAKNTDNCYTIPKEYNISLENFLTWNPSVNRGSCNNILTGATYCIEQSVSNVRQLAAKSHKKGTRRHRRTSTLKKSQRQKKTKKSTTTTTTTKKPIAKKPATKKKTTTTTTTTTKAVSSQKIKASKAKDQRKLLQKGADLTYYWIAHPDDYDHDGKSIDIKTCSGKSLGTVAQEYADALVMEGTGVIGSKIVNLGGCSCSNYNCFMEVDKEEDPFGLTSYGTALRPYITIAANDIKRNTKIYVPKLDGWEIPGSSKKHNGCLLVDDQSWSFEDNHIDFYVYREKNYKTLNGEHGINSVDIYEGGDCNLLNYI